MIQRVASALALTLAMTPAAAPGAQSYIDNVQSVAISSLGGGYQELVYNYEYQEVVSISAYNNVDSEVEYPVDPVQWIGIFHYDYAAGSFTEALYYYKDLFQVSF